MKSKISKIFLDDAGSFLGRAEGCLIVSDKKRNVEKYPLFENQIGEIQLKIGNSVSVAALATAAFWDIDVLITTQRGRPVAMLKGLDDDSHVKTRICQYEAINNGKGIQIAKKRGFEILQLSVFANNKRALNVYKKCGYKEIGRLSRDIKFPDGEYTDRILLELLLKNS